MSYLWIPTIRRVARKRLGWTHRLYAAHVSSAGIRTREWKNRCNVRIAAIIFAVVKNRRRCRIGRDEQRMVGA